MRSNEFKSFGEDFADLGSGLGINFGTFGVALDDLRAVFVLKRKCGFHIDVLFVCLKFVRCRTLNFGAFRIRFVSIWRSKLFKTRSQMEQKGCQGWASLHKVGLRTNKNNQ
jgi:hypothetical protein